MAHRFKAAATRAGVRGCEGCGWAPPAWAEGGSGRRRLALLQAHHVVPLAHGGADDAENLALVCPTCHALAHAMTRLRYQGERVGPATRGELLAALCACEGEGAAAWFAAWWAGAPARATRARALRGSLDHVYRTVSGELDRRIAGRAATGAATFRGKW